MTENLAETTFPGKVGLQQRILPAYRAPLFDRLAVRCDRGLSVFAGRPGRDESILPAEMLAAAHRVGARNFAPLKADNPLYLLWQWGIDRWLESWQPDVLIMEANSRYLSNRYAVKWMHARGRKVIGWGLGAPDILGKGVLAAIRRWERASYLRSLDGVIAYSARGAGQYRQAGINSGRVWVALNAADPRPTTPPPQRDSTGRPVVLYVGRLQARKRIDNLLYACARVEKEAAPELIIVGDGPERERLEALAREVYPRAEFAGDQRGASLDEYFRRADLFVLPGTGGLAVQQAMRHALPVIAAQGDGTQDDLVRIDNGWRVRPGDLDDLAATIQQALSDLPRLRKMGLESFRIVQEEANLENMVDIMIQAIRQTALPE